MGSCEAAGLRRRTGRAVTGKSLKWTFAQFPCICRTSPQKTSGRTTRATHRTRIILNSLRTFGRQFHCSCEVNKHATSNIASPNVRRCMHFPVFSAQTTTPHLSTLTHETTAISGEIYPLCNIPYTNTQQSIVASIATFDVNKSCYISQHLFPVTQRTSAKVVVFFL